MIRSDKKLKELALILGRKDNALIHDAVKALRDEEPYEGAIGLLVEHFDHTTDKLVRKTIEGFLNDLKDRSVRPEVIDEMKKPWHQDTISMLVASCWQSGLDYSDYLDVISEIFLKGDYATAIECMTVIEESVSACSRETKDRIIRTVTESPLSGINEKTALTLELVTILEK